MHSSKGQYIGACFEPANSTSDEDDAQLRGTQLEEDAECLPWLDKQEEHSVLYISFGSVGYFTPSQVEEIALGLEAAFPVGRPPLQPSQQHLPGRLPRANQRLWPRHLSWAPQLRVLRHPAVGGFLTHCGWNSTLESVCLGVPMLCLPIFGDQSVNAQLEEMH